MPTGRTRVWDALWLAVRELVIGAAIGLGVG